MGKSKAEVAAAFVEKRVKGVKITPYNGKIQDKDEEYYMQFKMVICGLDSVEARRWINATLIGMVDNENMESFKPLIDGGTEGEYLEETSASDRSSAHASILRFQRSGQGNITHIDFMHRMSARHACSPSSCASVHPCYDTTSTTALR